ncbi:MAG: VCBS repeat-containing protein [Acidobacteria bacterium]|nr:VCBS repeat-containing protein [Acidobacteriota bacterium]
MTHTTRPSQRLTLSALTLALCLFAVPFASEAQAQKKGAQKKSTGKAKPGENLLPEASQTPDPNRKPVATQLPPSILVRWQGKPGINRYRLQLATDEKFEDIVFDQAVEGRQYVVKDLPPGNYFWRVAPAAAETSIAYSTPERVTLGTEPKVAVASVVMPADATGWRVATGEVVKVAPASLRPGGVVDFVGLGADGRVFAVDGASGISLWTSRYNPAAGNQSPGPASVSFEPLVVGDPARGAYVVVATQGGVRALLGDTGRETWRASLEGTAVSGTASDLDGDGRQELVVVTEGPEMLYVINPLSGRVSASQKLSGAVAGPPYPFEADGKRGVLLGLRQGSVEFRGADGQVIGEAKLDENVTTAPLVMRRGEMSFMAVGGNSALWALSLPDLKVLGAIRAEDDSVRGSLAAADVDGDGSNEIVMVTKKGRVALVSTNDGTVRWFAEGGEAASSAAFADVNGDGVLDVIVPGAGSTFALAFSGRDGSLVMRVEESGKGAQSASGRTRTLVVTPALGGGGWLVGGDPAGTGLRAVELPKGSVKTASN